MSEMRQKNDQTPAALITLDLLSGVSLLFALAWILVFTPREVVMGDVQKVFYFHVAAGWVGMLGFLAAFFAGIVFLKTRDLKWDMLGVSSVEIGMVFAVLNIISGSIWAKPIWNTWWTWSDPRLATALIMVLIYAAYFLLRKGVDDPSLQARIAAIYAIVGFISVPFTFFSIRLFRTIHPVVIVAGGGSAGFDMSGRMLAAFMISLASFSILFAALLWHRYRLEVKIQKAASGQKFEGGI